MSDAVAFALAILIYPGGLTALGLAALYRFVLRGRSGLGLRAWRSREAIAELGGVALAMLGLALLPWPLHPLTLGAWGLAWVAVELAFLLPLVPALSSGVPLLARAALRTAQLGSLARALIWAALAGALVLNGQWTGLPLLVHGLALAATLIALPAAVGWGPFGPETRISPDGLGAGLPQSAQQLTLLGEDLRAGVLVTAIMVVSLPTMVLPPAVALALVVGGVGLTAAMLRNFAGRIPRMTLGAALQFCLRWSVPFALAATVGVVISRL